MQMPFDWYGINLDNWLNWLGSVFTNLYFLWEALWTDLSLLPNVGIHEWPFWLNDVWVTLFDDTGYLSWLGDVSVIELVVGSFLPSLFVITFVKGITSIVRR